MGWLKKIFASDPLKELEKAERLLADEPERALEMALAWTTEGSDETTAKLREFTDRARQAVIQRALQRADSSEEEEYFGDAAEWLEAAIEHSEDGELKEQLTMRRKELMRKELLLEEDGDIGFEVHETVEATVLSPEMDHDDFFDTVIDMLQDPVAIRYRKQGQQFRRLFGQFQHGEVEGLEESLSALLESDGTYTPDTGTVAVVTLERGRLRLLLGQFTEARQDFEACWDAWGVDHLDLANHLSIPGLWAEACLGEQSADPILDRLEDLAEPSQMRLDVMFPYAQALVIKERFEDAVPYLRDAMASFPSHQEFPQLYAMILAQTGKPEEAIACLEMAIAPSCASGNCGAPPMHLSSLRLLLTLHLASGDDIQRVKKLLSLLQEHTRGQLTAPDHRLMAAYYQKTDQQPAADLSLQRAEEIEAKPAELSSGIQLEKGPETMATESPSRVPLSASLI